MVAFGHAIDFTHDVTGREVLRSLGENVALAHTWDAVGNLTDQSLTAADYAVHRRTFIYRADGNLLGIDDQLNGARGFELDVDGRVTAVHTHNWAEAYAYDAAGNQTAADWPARHAGAEAHGPRSYNGTRIVGAGRIRYEHDAQGRITLRQKARLARKPETWRFSWNSEDRLTAVTTPDGQLWRYLYAPSADASPSRRPPMTTPSWNRAISPGTARTLRSKRPAPAACPTPSPSPGSTTGRSRQPSTNRKRRRPTRRSRK
ncbi:RHS repeat domain-containing protein [Streptomyces noursei]|uniref:RHS repeat domain-containing protein n=1 Tax=Streptomyces noursei TaxID=1971 RepID=UPI0030F3222B